jgi:hypothetical protein
MHSLQLSPKSLKAKMATSKHAAGSYQFDDGSTMQVSDEDAACLNNMLAKSSMAKQFKATLMKSKADFNAALKMAKSLKENTQVSRHYRDILTTIEEGKRGAAIGAGVGAAIGAVGTGAALMGAMASKHPALAAAAPMLGMPLTLAATHAGGKIGDKVGDLLSKFKRKKA